MKSLLSNFVSKVQTKHWQNLQRRTQKLDRSDKENLLEFLEDHLVAPSGSRNSGTVDDELEIEVEVESGNEQIEPSSAAIVVAVPDDDDDDDDFAEEDYELLQRDLDKANVRLEELQSKHDFLQTRLQTYRSKIRAAEELFVSKSSGGSGGDADADVDADAPKPPGVSMSPERLAAMKAKIEAYKKSLEPVEETYRTIASELASHQLQIESMQDRQLELKLKTQECQVVLQELSYTVVASTTVTGGEATTTMCLDDEDDEIGSELGLAIVDVDRASFEGEHASTEEDLENARTKREEKEEEDDELRQRQPQCDEPTTEAENTKGSLSIPVGTHAETE